MRQRIRERLFPRWIWRLPATTNAIALTFDDGPDPQTTPELLRALDDLGIPATMFVLGNLVKENATLLRECAAAGHSIAIHGYTHESCFWHSANWVRNSIRQTQKVLGDAGVPAQKLFRPPFGHFNPFTLTAARALDVKGVFWSHLVEDWIEQSVHQLETRLCTNLTAGDIVLLHDGHSTTHNVIRALPRLADEVSRNGWRFLPLTHSLLPQPTPQ